MAPTRRPQVRSQRSLEEILAAARALFGAGDAAAVTIDEVAVRAGRTKGSVYYHFASKDELFEAVFLAEHRSLVAAVEAATTGLEPEAALRIGLATYLRALATDLVAARITVVMAPAVLGWRRWRECDGGTFRLLVVATLSAARASGRLRPGAEPDVLADLLLGAVTETAVAIAADGDPGARAELAIKSLDGMLDAIFVSRS